MTHRRPRVGGFLPTKPGSRESDASAGGDFVWPPPADDPAACSIVVLEAEADRDGPSPLNASADEPWNAFPAIDVETALDAFADVRTTPSAREAMAVHASHLTGGPASWWRAGAMRTVVALAIGASLALAPSPGFSRVPGAQPLPAPAPAHAEPRVPTHRSVATVSRVHVASEPASDVRPGKVAPGDEDHIRATLADLQTAYAQLDADAAREVWPSVDVDALTAAFDGLKSQELRFDHCDVSVDGARARAACTGEAVYVPRLGNPASSSAARAWTFQLTRTRERWMIASARAS